MNVYLIALTPLLLAITALVIAMPIGLHYADKERAEREARVALEALNVTSAVWTAPVAIPAGGVAYTYALTAPFWTVLKEIRRIASLLR